MSEGERIAARARSLVGVRFRPQGRDPGLGLDCVGVAARATGLEQVRRDYALRGQLLAEIEHELCDLGLQPVAAEAARPGDVLVMAAGAAQLHMAIVTDTGFVHADAGLRLVVERPGPAPWPVVGVWRVVAAEGWGG